MNEQTGRRVALVTGGRRGIGLAVAEGLAVDGFDVAITGTRDDDVAKAAVARLAAHGVAAMFVAGDINTVSDHARVLDTVEAKLGAIDVLVSNAGIAPPQRLDLLETTPENFDVVLGVNLRGAFFLGQAVAKRMIARGGGDTRRALIFVSSCSAEMVSVNRIEYCISKAGLAMAVEGFAVRLAAEGIAVFEVRPGIIRSDMTAGVTSKYDALIDGGRCRPGVGEPADIAAVVSALAKGGLGFATGSVVDVDGGLTISRL